MLEAGEVTLGGGDGGVGDVLVVDGPGALAGGEQAEAARAVGGPSHQRAAEKALQVDGDVVLLGAQHFAPAPDFRECGPARSSACAGRGWSCAGTDGPRGFRAGVSFTIQSICAAGQRRFRPVSTGSAWTMSPSALGLMMRIFTGGYRRKRWRLKARRMDTFNRISEKNTTEFQVKRPGASSEAFGVARTTSCPCRLRASRVRATSSPDHPRNKPSRL